MTNILVVDDDPHVAEQITTFLDSLEYNSQFLLEPEYLFQMLEKKKVRLILLDIHMPGINGLTLLKQLKAHPAYWTIPVIMLTGDTNEKLLAECFETGAMDYINKPVREVELKARLNSALAIRNYISEIEKINQLLKNTFDGMAEGVVILDNNFHIKMISANACRMLDILEEESLGYPAVSVLGTSIAGPSGVLVKHAKNKKTIFDTPCQLLSASGIKTPVNLSIFPLDDLPSTSGFLLLFRNLRNEERLLREKARSFTFGRMVSCDSKMNEIFELIEKVALSHSVVLISGESGTGKELVAKEIHERSRKAQGPFHAVNCAAISPQLMESEFFGHERGAFTGAIKSKKGRFELANNGTLFLDEVAEIPLELQGKLLRALQEQEIEPVGSTRTISVDVRVVAATNKDLFNMVQNKLFRDDLFYRLNVIPILLPPLRERLQDIPLLTTLFIEELNKKEKRKIKNISPEVIHQLFCNAWPGNIRELYNVIEYAFAVSDGVVLKKKHLPDTVLDVKASNEKHINEPNNEKDLILQAMRQTNFSKPKAAALLGMHRTTLYRKLKKYNI
jgi:two-component system, NtrC family, response regulator HydG